MAFGGRASDKLITQQSGFLDLSEYGDLVLADRGFLIEEELASRGARLTIPSSRKGKNQLSMRQVEMSRRLARVRIHVERMMERIKNFKLLAGILPLSLVPHADNIITSNSYSCPGHRPWARVIICVGFLLVPRP